MAITLHQFSSSHFNEKARWALAWKQLPHERISYLPGPHMAAMKRLSGQRQTPVLDLNGEIIAGSAAIIDALERYAPDPPLLPADSATRQAALDFQARFDAEFGPAVRTMLFAVMIDHGSYFCQTFTRNKSLPKRWLYRATFPLARGLIAKANGVVDPENVQRARVQAIKGMDEIAARAAVSGFMVGDSFTVADLTAAALLAPVARVSHPDMARPEPLPDSVRGLLEELADHPAIAWTQQIYRAHRPD